MKRIYNEIKTFIVLLIVIFTIIPLLIFVVPFYFGMECLEASDEKLFARRSIVFVLEALGIAG